MAKVSKQAWIDRAMVLLATSGHQAVTLNALLNELGVSHGSFYHHFKNRQALTDAMLAHWEQSMTLDILQHTSEITALSQRVDSLIDSGQDAFALQLPLEIAIRNWAQTDDGVKAVMQRVDLLRRKHCQTLAALVVSDTQRAKVLGNLIHAVFVGSQQSLPAYSAKETQDVYRELQRLLISQSTIEHDQ